MMVLTALKSAYAAYEGLAVTIGGQVGLSAAASTGIANAALNLALASGVSAMARPESPR